MQATGASPFITKLQSQYSQWLAEHVVLQYELQICLMRSHLIVVHSELYLWCHLLCISTVFMVTLTVFKFHIGIVLSSQQDIHQVS